MSTVNEFIKWQKYLMFNDIPAPIRLEFFISLLIVIKYGSQLSIKPNYRSTNEGIPYSHAPGGIGDIEVFNDNFKWLLEVTLIRNRNQQLNHETTSVSRHFSDLLEDSTRIFQDTIIYCTSYS